MQVGMVTVAFNTDKLQLCVHNQNSRCRLLIPKCCVYIACFSTTLVYTIWLHWRALVLLLLCLSAAANFYMVVSQDVVTVAVIYLKWSDVCVGALIV